MPEYFILINIPHSESEKKLMYKEYKESSKRYDPLSPMASYKDFISTPHFDDFIDMKCLNCGCEVRENFAYYFHLMEDDDTPFPIDTCPECMKNHLVPIDVHRHLKLKVFS